RFESKQGGSASFLEGELLATVRVVRNLGASLRNLQAPFLNELHDGALELQEVLLFLGLHLTLIGIDPTSRAHADELLLRYLQSNLVFAGHLLVSCWSSGVTTPARKLCAGSQSEAMSGSGLLGWAQLWAKRRRSITRGAVCAVDRDAEHGLIGCEAPAVSPDVRMVAELHPVARLPDPAVERGRLGLPAKQRAGFVVRGARHLLHEPLVIAQRGRLANHQFHGIGAVHVIAVEATREEGFRLSGRLALLVEHPAKRSDVVVAGQ